MCSWRIALLERFWQAPHPPRYAAFTPSSSPSLHHSSSESVGRVAAVIEIAEGSASEQREPASALVLGTVVQHVAPLAERLEVRGPVVGRVVIKMRARQDHPRSPHRRSPQPEGRQLRERPPLSIAPAPRLPIPPATIAQVADGSSMRTATAFAPPLRPSETDRSRELGPVNGVEPAIAGLDGHQRWTKLIGRF